MKVGSVIHKNLFCKSFIQSHQRFEPEQLAWPDLDDAELERIRGVPFWQEVLYTEMRAIKIIDAFSKTVSDPQIREAIELMSYEETRHERLVQFLIDRYGIIVSQRALEPLSGNSEINFIDFGYGECVDSFLGFGFFKMARQAKFLPEPLFDILDRLMTEEIRHVLLIINWMAYREAQKGRRAAPLRALTSAWYYARAISSLVDVIVKNSHDEGDGLNFSATQAGEILEGFTLRSLLEECLAENERRMAEFENALLRPLLLPNLARATLAFMTLIQRILPDKPLDSGKVIRAAAIAIIMVAATLLGVLAKQTWFPPHSPALLGGVLLPTPRPIADFTLVSETGAPFTRANLLGHWTVVFAGYTYCPDVCPATLAQLKAAKAKLGTDANRLVVLFLSVDPERDTPEHLARYIRYFDPAFRAATGSVAQLESLAANLGLVFLKTVDAETGRYEIDHSAQLILVNPDGRLAGYLSPPFTPETLSADIKTALEAKSP